MKLDSKKGADREKIREILERHPQWPEWRQHYSDLRYWRGRYIWSRLKDKVLEVATQYQIDRPGEFEISNLYDEFDPIPSQKLESGLCVLHKSGGDITIRVAGNGIVLRLGCGLGGVGMTTECKMIVPEDVTTEDIEGWFKLVIEGKQGGESK